MNRVPSVTNRTTPPVVCRLTHEAAETLALIDKECNRPPWSAELFRQEFYSSTSLIFGVRSEGKLVGFLVAHLVVDEAHIVTFGIKSSYRRLGLARALIGHVISDLHLRGVRWVTLEVRESNEAARSLYESLGFYDVGTRQRYYSDDQEDAIVLSLNVVKFVGSVDDTNLRVVSES